MQIRSENFWRYFGFVFLFLSVWFFFVQRSALQALATEPITSLQQKNLPSTGVAQIFIILAIILLISTFVFKPGLKNSRQILIPRFVSWGLTLVLLLGTTVYLFLTPHTALWNGTGRMALYVLICGACTWILAKSNDYKNPVNNFIVLLLIAGVLYRIGIFLPEIQTYPFSLGWSESSRYYNASLYFSKMIYGSNYPLPVLHPSRYLMQSVPFLFAPQNILVHRIWQIFLWIGMTLLGAYSVARRISNKNQSDLVALTFWLFLFFFQGAVYYHLMGCVILVMLGYNKDSFWKTLVFVLLSSIWAGISRVNWYPVPALLAVSIYLLEEPVLNRNWIIYLKKPAIWAVSGFVTAYLSNRIYALLSGNDVSQFSSSFSSYMIWSRLLPNSTYTPGIILAFLLVSLPSVILAWITIRHNGWKYYWHWVRVLGLTAILAIFALGGIIVSVKIGGGGDLHNLDAYLVFLAIISTYLIFYRYVPQSDYIENKIKIPFLLLIPVLFVPLYFTFQNGVSWNIKDTQSAKANVQLLQKGLDVLKNELPGPILFISERQLLSFGNIHGIELVPDYEKVFLMEMVMANNKPYLDKFHQKLEQETYSAIIIDSLSEIIQDPEDSFWVENNLWVDKVILPLLQYYEPVYTLQDRNVNVLIPRGNEKIFDQLKKLAP
ncbi:MAG: hypothetical protein CVU46_02990 [Chloroflexi bacterium HGW-Chloroflexi-8]|nr:MAG: hypothetical protein CVU46_02990 [Chloroflexi bacterium HGW-Chloroflexi-8]